MRPRECGHGGVATASLDTGNDLPYAWFKSDFEFQEKYFRDGNQYPIGVYTSTADYFVEGSTTQQFYAEYAQQPYVVTESVTGNWYDAHQLYASSNPPQNSEEYKNSVATVSYTHLTLPTTPYV